MAVISRRKPTVDESCFRLFHQGRTAEQVMSLARVSRDDLTDVFRYALPVGFVPVYAELKAPLPERDGGTDIRKAVCCPRCRQKAVLAEGSEVCYACQVREFTERHGPLPEPGEDIYGTDDF